MRKLTEFVGKQSSNFTELAYLLYPNEENAIISKEEFITWCEKLEDDNNSKVKKLSDQNFRVIPTSARPNDDYRQVSCSSCLKAIDYQKSYVNIASDFRSANICEECFREMDVADISDLVQD